MGFGSTEQTFGSGFSNQERRPLAVNRGLLNTLWWSGLGMTAVIIGVGVFIFLLQSPDEPQDFTVETVPFEPVSPEKVEQPSIPAETIPSLDQSELVFDVPEILFQNPITPKFSDLQTEEPKNDPVIPEVKSKPVRISSDKKKTKFKIVEKMRQKERVSPVIPRKAVRPHKVPTFRFVNILSSMDMQDNRLLTNAFENMKSNLFYAWDNKLSGYTYEVILRPAYSNNSGAPCRTATLKSWQEPQSRTTAYKQQMISACRSLQSPIWYVR